MKKFALLLALLAAMTFPLVACDTAEPTETAASTQAATQAATEAPATQAPATEAPATEAPSTKVTYTVTVVDQNGAPVAGVEIQMCDDTSCKMPAPTNAEGVATFSYDPSNYHVTVIAIPEGYAYAEGTDATTAIDFPEGSTELTVTLTKS